MINKFINSKIIYENNNSIGRLVAASEYCDFVHLSIEAGAIIEKHVLELYVSFFVIGGKGEITLEEQIFEAQKCFLLLFRG